MNRVEGYCPMGCGRTLFLGDGGHVTCSLAGCPDPGIVDAILTDPLGCAHIVTLRDYGFSVTHPLRERYADLTRCGLHRHLRSLDGPPAPPGVYRANGGGDYWHFDSIQELPS